MFVARRMDPAWLKQELDKPGRSQSALARFLGLDHPSIVNRMVSGARQIKANEADKIRAYLDSTNKDPATLSTASQAPGSVAKVKVRGIVEAGSWRDLAYVEEFSEELIAPQSVADSGAYALKVSGPSMNEVYSDGSYVIVQPWYGGAMPIGKHVIVERERPDGLVETTVKELRRSLAGDLELWPRSKHPSHQTPIPFDEADEVLVRVIGLVTWSLAPAP